ncbi:hypothetical protein E1301_Tti021987 [Triplophysa tibetana]|uniref:Uncharacterized protein n=1 Tax=Triplophysa tibetana TaxID=1572043 RepID=A0A5A9P953_9TELE|nr:hypothetical protein E1301_Tti021987 [Triplophysa tibetana]
MKETALYRAKWIRQNGTKSIAEVVREFPHLLSTPGMISQDFDQVHGETGMKLFESWAAFFAARILRLAVKEEKFNQPLEDIPQVYRVGQKVFRPSIDEASKAFIELQPIGTNVVEFLRRTELTKPFPFVLAMGNIRHISQAFVILNGQALEQTTLLSAVDVCFKAFYVFDVNFPRQCASTWEFLQTVVFQMEGNESFAIRFLRCSLHAEE